MLSDEVKQKVLAQEVIIKKSGALKKSEAEKEIRYLLYEELIDTNKDFKKLGFQLNTIAFGLNLRNLLNGTINALEKARKSAHVAKRGELLDFWIPGTLATAVSQIYDTDAGEKLNLAKAMLAQFYEKAAEVWKKEYKAMPERYGTQIATLDTAFDLLKNEGIDFTSAIGSYVQWRIAGDTDKAIKSLLPLVKKMESLNAAKIRLETAIEKWIQSERKKIK